MKRLYLVRVHEDEEPELEKGEKVREMLKDGVIDMDTMIRPVGGNEQEWKPCSAYEELCGRMDRRVSILSTALYYSDSFSGGFSAVVSELQSFVIICGLFGLWLGLLGWWPGVPLASFANLTATDRTIVYHPVRWIHFLCAGYVIGHFSMYLLSRIRGSPEKPHLDVVSSQVFSKLKGRMLGLAFGYWGFFWLVYYFVTWCQYVSTEIDSLKGLSFHLVSLFIQLLLMIPLGRLLCTLFMAWYFSSLIEIDQQVPFRETFVTCLKVCWRQCGFIVGVVAVGAWGVVLGLVGAAISVPITLAIVVQAYENVFGADRMRGIWRSNSSTQADKEE